MTQTIDCSSVPKKREPRTEIVPNLDDYIIKPGDPLFVIVGATGARGGSVIKALSRSNKLYRIRGLSRDTCKRASQDLTKQGNEVYQVDVVVGNEEAVKKKSIEGATYNFVGLVHVSLYV